ncbi:undecaprenyl-diphosphate phosphatase [Anthocerotibacter panamensis]|uniref:undecaprenyl-diphosphate phosphatase n=1 Tax=Anthocerotibacter panamensis TaxID=2857077 RepID=UPI001C40417E|nr:undecaprenyl-diphosphate phosphatase [Anthocerotibacter panamensis]
MNGWQAAVLGLVQGITEFLPISSTAHLKVIPVLLGWGDPGVAFTAIIQLGSLGAVLTYFAQDLWTIARGAWQGLQTGDRKRLEVRLFWSLLIGTLPIVAVGLALKPFLERDDNPLRGIPTIAIASIVMALLLGVAEVLGKRKRPIEKVRVLDGILIGCAQTLALVPGVSRSGSTLTTALFLGLQRADAARFSFLLGIPAIFLSGLLELKTLYDCQKPNAETICNSLAATNWGVLAIGVVSSAVFSYLAIAWLLQFLKTRSTLVFIGYRLLFGVGLLWLVGSGLIRS